MNDKIVFPGLDSMNRRSFIKTAAAAAFATAAFPHAGHTEAPRKGGALRLGLNGGSSADTLDPTQLIGTFSINVSRQVYNTLVEIGDDGKPAPELAASWQASDGNKRWILNLRPGVQFHNGKTFDAEDVKYSLGLHIGDKTKSKAKGLVADIAEVRAASPTQVEILLKSPNPDMDYVLSDLHFAIVPAGFADWPKAIGTGPFKLTAFQPGVRATAARNEAYWRSDRGHVDTVETLVINDATARVSALQGGSVHIVNGIDYKIAPLLKKDPRAYLVVTEGKQHFSLPMDATKEPFTNADVVLALKHAIDREQMVKLLMAGYGRVGNDHPIAASDPSFNPNIAQRAYDPDKARFHLKKAGKSDLALELHAAPVAFEQAVNTAELFAQSVKSAGITISVKREPDDGYWSDVWMKKPWVASFWAGRPSASMMFASVYASGAPWNETHWKNDSFDSKLAESRSFADPAKRREVYFELQQMIHDECPTIIPAFASWIDAARKGVKGFVPNPNFLLSDHRVAERVWLAA
ncbi:MAG: ABC transporter substrate-binding protein [Mesorhizobium sp.]|nr:MAG: ABC transporter substrate-binding protein [Mesorhizobium sp.]